MGKQYLNGILYGTGEIIKFSPEIYSLEEREVGVWTDGKPLYQRTWNIGNFILTSPNIWYPTNISISANNIEQVKGIVQAVSDVGTVWDNICLATNINDYIQLNSSRNSGGIQINLLTLQYTKTTDVAGSGHYTTNGGETHHYSTTEQVVGTWIDGKPIYEKTVNFGALPNSTSKSISHGISNLDYVVSINGTAQRTTGLNRIQIPFVNVDNIATQIRIMVSDTDIAIQCGSDRSDFTKCYITIQYTKTTD